MQQQSPTVSTAAAIPLNAICLHPTNNVSRSYNSPSKLATFCPETASYVSSIWKHQTVRWKGYRKSVLFLCRCSTMEPCGWLPRVCLGSASLSYCLCFIGHGIYQADAWWGLSSCLSNRSPVIRGAERVIQSGLIETAAPVFVKEAWR